MTIHYWLLFFFSLSLHIDRFHLLVVFFFFFYFNNTIIVLREVFIHSFSKSDQWMKRAINVLHPSELNSEGVFFSPAVLIYSINTNNSRSSLFLVYLWSYLWVHSMQAYMTNDKCRYYYCKSFVGCNTVRYLLCVSLYLCREENNTIRGRIFS